MCDCSDKRDPTFSSLRPPIILSAPENHSKKRILENTPKTSPFKLNDVTNGISLKSEHSGTKPKQAKEKKLKCLFHKDSKITNFCTNSTCLMPLCSYCMEDHINKHHAAKTKPQITTYDHVREYTMQQINDSINLISKNKELFSNLKGVLDTHNLKLYKQLAEMRTMAFQIVDNYFKNMQNSLNEQIKQEYQYNKASLDEVESILLENERNLQKMAAGLAEGYTSACKHIIMAYKDNLFENTEYFASQMEDRINIMRAGGIQLQGNEGELEGLQGCLSRSFFLAREKPDENSRFNDHDPNPKIHLLPNPNSNNHLGHNNFRPIRSMGEATSIYEQFPPPPLNYPPSPPSHLSPPLHPSYPPAASFPPSPSFFPPPYSPSYFNAPLSYPPFPPSSSSFPPPPNSSFPPPPPPPSSSFPKYPPFYPTHPSSHTPPPFGLTSSTFSPSGISFASGERGGLSRSEVNFDRVKPSMRMDAPRVGGNRF